MVWELGVVKYGRSLVPLVNEGGIEGAWRGFLFVCFGERERTEGKLVFYRGFGGAVLGLFPFPSYPYSTSILQRTHFSFHSLLSCE